MKLEPFRVGRLESEEITGLAGVVGAVHVGVEEDVEVWREVQLVQCKNVVSVGGGCVWILEEIAKVVACAREVCWIRW